MADEPTSKNETNPTIKAALIGLVGVIVAALVNGYFSILKNKEESSSIVATTEHKVAVPSEIVAPMDRHLNRTEQATSDLHVKQDDQTSYNYGDIFEEGGFYPKAANGVRIGMTIQALLALHINIKKTSASRFELDFSEGGPFQDMIIFVSEEKGIVGEMFFHPRNLDVERKCVSELTSRLGSPVGDPGFPRWNEAVESINFGGMLHYWKPEEANLSR